MDHEVAVAALFAQLRARGVAESTARSYLGVLQSLEPGWTDLRSFRSPAKYKATLDALAPSTRWVRISTVNTILRDARLPRSAWSKLQRVAKGKLPPGNARSAKQEANWVPRSESDAAFASAVTGERWLDALLLLLFTQMPPRRTNDYVLMRVRSGAPGDGDAGWNWFDPVAGSFTFNVYKTARVHGSQVLRAPAQVWMLWTGMQGGTDFLLGKRRSGAWVRAQLARIFGRPVGPSLLRACYVTQHAGVTESRELANAMGHTVGIQQGVYAKTM